MNSATNPTEGEKKIINSELWQACAGPLVNLPATGTHVVYFPQGHSEQVAASMKKDVNGQFPNYPNLPSKLICLLHDVTLHADPETDEVYAQMTLQPVPSFDQEALLRSEISMKANKPQSEFFCKTLTASDTSTHGGFSVPRRAAEKILPPLDFAMQPPAQELVARDLNDNLWTFRHIYRGQPKRHLLTTGWSLFISGKKLSAGDSVLFIRDEKQHLLLGTRRANRQPTNISASVLSSDSMHIGILAAAAHAAANSSPFTVFYNPRTSPSEFVIPLAKYYKAVCSTQISLGMRFRMVFETEDSGTRRYMGTVTGLSDMDPVRWKNSQWRNLQVGWDESTVEEKCNRVSIWEIEPVIAPFFICPTSSFFRMKRSRQYGMPDDDPYDVDYLFKRAMPWPGDDFRIKNHSALPGLSLAQWMNMQQNPSFANSMQPNSVNSLPGSAIQNLTAPEVSRQLGVVAPQISQQNYLQFNTQSQTQQPDQLQKLPSDELNPLGSSLQPQEQLPDMTQQQRQSLNNQLLPTSQVQPQLFQGQHLNQSHDVVRQKQSTQSQQMQINLPQNLQQQQHILSQGQQHNVTQPNHTSENIHMSDNQIQLQFLQKLHEEHQSLPAQQSAMQQPSQVPQLQDQQKPMLDGTQDFSRFVSSSSVLSVPPTSSVSLPQSQITGTNSIKDFQFTQTHQQTKMQTHQLGMFQELYGHVPTTNQLSPNGSSLLAGAVGGGQSVLTDDIPSCSTSPSTNNCPSVPQPTMNGKPHCIVAGNKVLRPFAPLLSQHSLEFMPADTNLGRNMQQKPDMRPSVNISKIQDQGYNAPQNYNNTGAQIDYVDSSSATSVCFDQNDEPLQPNANSVTLNSLSMFFSDASMHGESQGDHRSNIPFGVNIDSQFVISGPSSGKGLVDSRKDFLNDLSSVGGMVSGYENTREAQPELSSSMVSQSFGVADMAFNSIDSSIKDSSFLNNAGWAPPPQLPRIRTYTKVYKRGAVGRSIDITRYSGYEELKQDLARRFGIEGQLEDHQRIGWKLVYVDHENDVLLVGDDPWEEFVNCVKCIKILSPQEVQQMSLDGDFGTCVLPDFGADGANL